MEVDVHILGSLGYMPVAVSLLRSSENSSKNQWRSENFAQASFLHEFKVVDPIGGRSGITIALCRNRQRVSKMPSNNRDSGISGCWNVIPAKITSTMLERAWLALVGSSYIINDIPRFFVRDLSLLRLVAFQPCPA